MNILFITPSYKPAYIYGGPIVVIALLAENLIKLGHSVTVYTTTANGKEELNVEAGKAIVVDGVQVFYFPRNTGDHTHVSFGLWRRLNETAAHFDAIHIHSWWNLLVIGAARICRRKNIVPLLSPHGMFSDYILETNNSRKKKWIHKLAGKRLLESTRLHVSTEMEWKESQRIIPGWKGGIVPNLVVLPAQLYERKENGVFTIGFLSRIDPKKGLDILIRALSKVSFPYRLLVAGSGDPAYVASLQQQASKSGNSDCIEWLGWKTGEEKFRFLSQLDLFALTSHSENFAIVVIESLSVGTPVLISKEVGLFRYVEQHGFGWISSLKEEEVTTKLETIYLHKTERNRIESNSPAIIRQDFDSIYLAQQYVHLYQNKS